ncbi:MAG: NAD(P)/FAD-dependent oxidoreductase, partial [Alphaproteobacteria bacterium]
MKKVDVIIAGAGFAGLACAKTLARRGLKVIVLERKRRPGLGIHTTGILVKEAAQNLYLPEHLTRKISGIQLYSPSLKSLTLQTSDYYFLTTDTPALMRHFSNEAETLGAEILYGTPYSFGTQTVKEIVLPSENLCCRYLIGA